MDDYRKNNIGFVFQNFNLIPHLSVLENVTIAMQMTDTNEKDRNQRAVDILTEVGTEGSSEQTSQPVIWRSEATGFHRTGVIQQSGYYSCR